MTRFIVLTGGPGSGKSKLLAALATAGFLCKPEAGRAIIRQQAEIGGTALPWSDPSAFAELMLSWDIRSYCEARKSQADVFFDRGVIDVLGYLRLSRLPIPPHIARAAQQYRYQREVFIAPPWRDIFTRDTERKQDFAEAEATCRVMAETYSDFGYRLIALPLVSVADRVKFVRETLGARLSEPRSPSPRAALENRVRPTIL